MKHTNDIIAAQHFEGELYIKASDHHRIVRDKVAAEREACAKVCESLAGQQWVTREAALECSDAIRARGNT
jgi:hypothetical protein